MSRNRALLEKADLAIADLIADGGYLEPEQSKKFFRILIEESRLLKMITFRPMNAPKLLLEGTRFGSMILRPGTPGQALAVGDRSKPDLHKVELDTSLFKGEVRLNDEVLEDIIENGNFKQTVMQMMAERISVDMETVVVQGDTGSADPTLAVLDGIIKQAATNVVAGGGIAINKQMLTDAIKTMPKEFLRNKRSMRFLTSVDAEVDWRNLLAERATTVGDKFLEQDAPTLFSGVPLVDIPVFPENLGLGTDETVILFCDPKNVVVGVQRNVRIETDKDITSGEFIIVATLRFDVKYQYEPAVVKVTGVTIS